MQSSDYRSVQYATHRIRIKLIPHKTYGLMMNTSDYSMRLFINGDEVDCVGIPGDSLETTVPRTKNRATYYFTPQRDTVELIVQASNFVHREGAYPPSFYIGYAENITRAAEKELFITCILIGCLVTSFLYHIGLYVVNRRRKSSALLFAVCSFLMIFMAGRPVQVLLPEYNWYFAIRFEYIVHYLTFAAFARFLQTLYPELFHKVVLRIFYIICGTYIVTTLIFPPAIFSSLVIGFETAASVAILYILVRLAGNFRNVKMQNILTFVGMLVVALFGFNDILMKLQLPSFGSLAGQPFATPLGMVFFVFCNSLALAFDYADTERAYVIARENEQRLVGENDALDRVNRMRSELVATVSHETRTPLAVLSGYAELISMELRQKGVDEQTTKDLDKISDEVQRIATLMDEMQNFSKRESNTYVKSRLNIKEVIDSVTRLYKPVLERNHTAFSLDLPETLPDIYANPNEITQVLFNLLQNARNHIDEGKVEIKAKSDGEFVIVSVSDTGTGIPEELRPRIFERGVTGDKEGSGLGLSICKEIISDHGGTIFIKSELGKGTEVQFSLPIFEEGSNYGRTKNNFIG